MLFTVEFRLANRTQHRGNAIESLYKSVRSRKRLVHSWQKVSENGRLSKCHNTRRQIAMFSSDADKNLEIIYRDLLRSRFSFAPARGVLIERPGKKPRPLVVSPIPDRIVQRSILEVLQAQSGIQRFLSVPTSFGGIETRGVRHAIESACRAMSNGGAYFIRTDIKSFFTQIRRETVLERISGIVNDEAFRALLREAVTTELSNLDELRNMADLFPLYEIGVAQGCCLSPLFGNILLYDFDLQMNQGAITCLRYIDDFILMGPDRKKVRAAFARALNKLEAYGLEVYDPLKDKGKAEEGYSKDGFEFLGCHIMPGLVRPNRKARESILKSIRELLDKSIASMSNPERACKEKTAYADTLVSVSNVLKGWGDHYSFCNDIEMMAMLDEKIDKLLINYIHQYEQRRKVLTPQSPLHGRRLLGVHLLIDSNRRPILPLN